MSNDAYILGAWTGILGLIQITILISGLVAAVRRRKKHPRVSLMLSIALGMMIGQRVIAVFGPLLAISIANSFAPGEDKYRWFMLIQSLFSGLVFTVSLAILIFAALGWRDNGISVGESNQSAADPTPPSYSDFDPA
jgi:hypothetical protein